MDLTHSRASDRWALSAQAVVPKSHRFEPFEAAKEGHKAEAAAVFLRLDEDGSGALEWREVYVALEELGIDPNCPEVLKAVEDFDQDGNGSLDRREFANVMRRLCPGIDDANIAAAFVALDTDESGTIELDEFVRGQPVLEEEKKKWRQKKKPRRKKSLLEPKEGFLEGGRKFTAF